MRNWEYRPPTLVSGRHFRFRNGSSMSVLAARMNLRRMNSTRPEAHGRPRTGKGGLELETKNSKLKTDIEEGGWDFRIPDSPRSPTPVPCA
jgi:hypothetical protein